MRWFRAAFLIGTFFVALSFLPAFWGTDSAPGLADQIFPNRSGGFRGDVVCMTLCGAAFVVWSLFAMGRWFDDRNGKNKVDAALGGIWMLEYVLYIRHLLNHLWMG